MDRDEVLTEQLVGDGDGFGAHRVEPRFVHLLANISDEAIAELGREWLGNTVTADTESALKNLVSLCRVAEREHLAVVHWSE